MHQEEGLDSRKNAYLGILLLGIVSLMGDVVYEGSRGIVSGFLADTTRAYWVIIYVLVMQVTATASLLDVRSKLNKR